MKSIKPFKLSHVTLYAKGWYNKSNDVYTDLLNILKLDDYTPFENNDVIRILLYNYEESFNIKLIDFISDIHESNCWKVGYPKDLKYDLYTAIIYKILFDIKYIEDKNWIVKCPKYSKENPRPSNIELKKVIEVFNKQPKYEKVL